VRPLPRRQRVVVMVWVILAAALWNAIFEMMVVRGAKEYLFRAARTVIADTVSYTNLTLPTKRIV
jgi:hypothetical protein